MKKLTAIFMISLLTMTISFNSCKKDDDEKVLSSGIAAIDGDTVVFDKGYLVYEASQFHIALYSPEIDLFQESGVGDWLVFSLNTGTETFNGGNFTFSEQQTAGTFDYGHLAVNVDWEFLTGGQNYDVVEGTVSINRSGSSYEIEYDVLAQSTTLKNIGDTIPISGFYKGILTYFEVTSENKKKFHLSN